MSDTPEKPRESAEPTAPKVGEPTATKLAALSETGAAEAFPHPHYPSIRGMSYREWMIGQALKALLMRNGPYKEVAEHAVQSVDKVLKILDAEPDPVVGKAE